MFVTFIPCVLTFISLWITLKLTFSSYSQLKCVFSLFLRKMPKMQSLMAGMQSKGNWLFKKKTVHKVLAQKEIILTQEKLA